MQESILTMTAFNRKAEYASEFCIVADRFMRIKRQVISHKMHAGLHQMSDSTPLDTSNSW